jgi:hypothetical protein
MSLRVMTQGGGTGGASASIFVTGLSEADTVTATKDGKPVNGVLVQKPNPAVVVPSGYTQLEYIQQSGSAYLDTGYAFNTNNIRTVLDFIPVKVDDWLRYAGAYNGNGRSLIIEGRNGTFNFGVGNEDRYSTYKINVNTRYLIDATASGGSLTAYINGTKFTSSYTGNPYSGRNQYLFCLNTASGPSGYVNSIVYNYKMYNGGTLVRDFIPAKRNSDGAVGMYDRVNSKFYTHSGSGSFIAGTAIPATTNVFLVEPIKKYGVWMVTATNGKKTATQDVLVDAAIEFEIELNYSA